MQNSDTCRIVVLISGNGTNLQAIIDQINTGTVPARIVAVISNKETAHGLTRAKKFHIPTAVVDNKQFDNREDYDKTLADCIDQYQPDLVVLAGFMRILTSKFVNHYLGRMINIHPSLLPKFRGLNTHQRAIDEGETKHGASVHFVTPELDDGPVIVQSIVQIQKNDSAQSLAEKVHKEEHKIYPMVISWFAMGRIKFDQEKLTFDEKELTQPIVLE